MQSNVISRPQTLKASHTILLATAFVIGNIILPQLFHLMPDGGKIWLPIYLFTLVGSYRYGWKVGLLTALFSPLINSFLFGMPLVSGLPAIMIKSGLLAMAASFIASKCNVSILSLLAVILSYQIVGTGFEWIIKGDFFVAIQDFRIGIPGMFLQLFGGYMLIKSLGKINHAK